MKLECTVFGVWVAYMTVRGRRFMVVGTCKARTMEEALNYYLTGAYAYSGTVVYELHNTSFA